MPCSLQNLHSRLYLVYMYTRIILARLVEIAHGDRFIGFVDSVNGVAPCFILLGFFSLIILYLHLSLSGVHDGDREDLIHMLKIKLFIDVAVPVLVAQGFDNVSLFLIRQINSLCTLITEEGTLISKEIMEEALGYHPVEFEDSLVI